MMGRSHVVCAAAGWALLAPPLAAALDHPLDPVGFVATLAVAAGAGVGPDIDHPNATVARTHGFISNALAEVIERVSGGHRRATHWLATGVAVGVAVTMAERLSPRWALAVALAICGAWALRVSNGDCFDRDGAPFIAAAVGFAAYLWVPPVGLVGAAVGFGWCAHIVCDWVCRGDGVPLLGPVDRERYAAHLFRIGGRGEARVAWLASVAAAAVAGRFLIP